MDCTEIFRQLALCIIYPAINIYIWTFKALTIIFLPFTKFMVYKRAKEWFGIKINGKRATDIQVVKGKERAFYSRVAVEKSLGFFESYVDKEWECKDLFGLVCVLLGSKNFSNFNVPGLKLLMKFNLQTAARVWAVGQEHYDKANPIVFEMTGKYKQYTCGYWKTATDLDQAQKNKMELIAQKLMLKPGMKVLDIGCGYGTLCHYLAEHYGVQTVGCSVSEEQTKYAIKAAKEQGLSCEFILADYRDFLQKEHKGEFDRVVSVGMFEHIGQHNYKIFFKVVEHCLKDEGIMLLHTIGQLDRFQNTEGWGQKYIFPYAEVPHFIQIAKAINGIFLVEDVQNFGFDYYKTLCEWEKNYDAIRPRFEEKYGEKYCRIFKVYLIAGRAMFYSRVSHLFQLVLSKNGIPGGYYAAR